MSTLIYNANIYCSRGNFAQAVLIENGIIRAVGTNEALLALAPADAERYDADGRTIVPGFNDSHMHLQTVGELLGSIQLLGATGIGDVRDRIRAFIEKNHPAPGSVLYGMGWNQDYFTDEPRLLRSADLDEVSTEYPIILERACGHILVANTAAIQKAGITNDTAPVPGGAIDHDESGVLTGIFRENATQQILCIRPERTVERVAESLRLAMRHAAEWGVTSVQTMDVRPADWRTTLAAYREVQKDAPTLRIYHQCNFMTPEGYREFLDEGYRTGDGDAFNRIGPLKIFVDGSLGARTALMRRPYHDDPSTCGIGTLTQAQFNELVKMAVDNHCQVVTHAIGDGAIELVLNGYDTVLPREAASAGGSTKKNPLRLGVVHCQITDMPLLQRFADHDILALVQPIFLHYDTTIVEERVGKALASTSYAFETLRKMGVHESFGTDSPVEDLNPFHNLYCAVTRKRLDGTPEGGFYPSECMDIYDAVDAYTKESAYVSFDEKVKGRIAEGYYADLVVLDRNIFSVPSDEIKDIQAVATMVDGRFVYRNAQLS